MKFEIAPKSTEIRANWYDARLYCFALNIDGKTGWRLPNKEELDEIYQSENDSENDFEIGWDWYWSSTEYNDDLVVWIQYFYNGLQNNGKKNSRSGYVRAIRDI
jgi:hypothetical protein